MIIIFVFVLLVFSLILLLAKDSFLGALFFLLLVVALIVFNISLCNAEQSNITNLYAGYNDSNISGTFFLGSGSIDNKEVVYYWVDNNGVKSKHSHDMAISTFVEDNGNYMVEKSLVCPSQVSWLFLPGGISSVEFHVPEHSIATMYQYK